MRAPGDSYWLSFIRLRHHAGTVEKEDSYLLVGLPTNIYTTVNVLRRLVPIDLPWRDLEALALTTIAVFDGKGIAVQDHRYTMEGVAMPGHRLARRKTETTDENRPTLEEDFIGHSRFSSTSPTISLASPY
jgi:hypothetical protein